MNSAGAADGSLAPRFLSVDEVLLLHERSIGLFGGTLGLRDPGLLESAVMSPRAAFGGAYLHEDLFAMAAAYAFHIAENQPFIDGNKRTALASAATFLDLNGFVLRDDHLYAAMLALADRSLDKRGLTDLFRREASLRPANP